MKTTGICLAVAAVLFRTALPTAAPAIALATFATASAPTLVRAESSTAAAATAVGPASSGAATRAALRPDSPLATKPARCGAPADVARLGVALRRTARRLASGQPIKIVAIGSSSTAGAMASSPSASYPSRLAVELKQRFPSEDITVLNRGVNGEEAADMLQRFDTEVVAEKPDLILWQVGTNAVLRDHPLDTADRLIRDGVRQLKATGADIVLVDPQFSPKVIAKPEAEAMVELIDSAAKRENVALFRRFAMMRHWREDDHMEFDTFVSPDGLHMNDWSYACWAKVLSGAIAEAASAPTTVAHATGAVLRTR